MAINKKGQSLTAMIMMNDLLKSKVKVVPHANRFKHPLNNSSINLINMCHTGSQDYTYWWYGCTISENL